MDRIEAHIDHETMMVERCSACGSSERIHLIIVREAGVCASEGRGKS